MFGGEDLRFDGPRLMIEALGLRRDYCGFDSTSQRDCWKN